MTAITRPLLSLTADAALTAASSALAHGRAEGKALVAAVVDGAGDVLALLRADGAFAASLGIATDKARTAQVFGVSTDDLCAGLTNEVLRSGIALRPHVILFGGGFPLRKDGQLIGAIGVSGGSEEDDRAAAQAGIRALNL